MPAKPNPYTPKRKPPHTAFRRRPHHVERERPPRPVLMRNGVQQQKCVVCEDLGASKHYGNLCCSGCKGFFRRSIRYRRQYVCVYSNMCDITKDSRNCCRACRLRVCLERGLQPILVHSDRARDADAAVFGKKSNSSKSMAKGHSHDDACSGIVMAKRAAHAVQLAASRDEPRHEGETLLATSRLLHKADRLPLGTKKMIPLFDHKAPPSVQRFLFMVDHLVDTYAETQEHLFSTTIDCNSDTGLAEAFFEPGIMVQRVPLQLDARIDFVLTGTMFQKMWCRIALHYVDWASHLPQLEHLAPEDRMRMLVGRCIPTVYHIIALRCTAHATPCIPLCGGAYAPVDASKWENTDIHCISVASAQIAEVIFDNYLRQLRAVNASDTEIRLLRVIAFFSMVPGLSKEGRRIVRSAQAMYRRILYDFVVSQNPHLSPSSVTERISTLVASIQSMEATSYIEDNYFSPLAMFNRECQSNLLFEFYVKRSFR